MIKLTQEKLDKNTKAYVMGVARLKDKWTGINWERVDMGLMFYQFGTIEMYYNSDFAHIFNKTVDALLDIPTPYGSSACAQLVGGLSNPEVKNNFRIFENIDNAYKYVGVYLSIAYHFMRDRLDLSIHNNIILADN